MVFYFGGFIKLVTFYILIELQILFSEYVDLIGKLTDLAVFWNKYLWTILEINLFTWYVYMEAKSKNNFIVLEAKINKSVN